MSYQDDDCPTACSCGCCDKLGNLRARLAAVEQQLADIKNPPTPAEMARRIAPGLSSVSIGIPKDAEPRC